MVPDRDDPELGLPDWRIADEYRFLSGMERGAFAWEWLRRGPAYRQTWDEWACITTGSYSAAERFSLAELEDPGLPAGSARPIWLAEIDGTVVLADILPIDPAPGEGIDLLEIASLVTLAVDPENREHLLLSDGVAMVRLDIARGTLLGGRMQLAYRLSGISKISEPLMTLRRLVPLILTGSIPRKLLKVERLADRWIQELRVADAIAAGATHQDIARALFGALILDRRWRSEGDAVRLRVQRLVRKAQQRLRDGAHFQWFQRR
ncbi:DUF2285 domain-containing protein [Sphingomonas sp.]|uniref:transcriptional regulator domain-containing protein n=1 Tax=Sphingomonas sp. TaxID=28214 RepID=UPI0025FFDBEB|nr:DUF2285 domain-containing protein [Sphingomonas sp.]